MKRLFKSKVALIVLATAAISLGAFGYHKASAGTISDCSSNSIIKCGRHTPGAFIAKVRTNNPRDLKPVYNYFNLPTSEYTRFANTAQMGMAYRDGTIKVGGRVVATDAWSIGRTGFSYSSPMTIAGHKYYRSANNRVLKQNLPVMVTFDNRGVMQTAIMTACGNPTTGRKVVPEYRCNLLRKSAVQGQKDTYRFTTSASASKGAAIAKVVYNFGDGSAPVTKTSLSAPVTHHYSKTGNFTARVTVYVKLPGNHQVTVTSATCTTPITVKPPKVTPPKAVYSCEMLKAIRSENDDLSYTFQTVTTKQNATLVGADFIGDDGINAKGVQPQNNEVSLAHTYSKAGDYKVQATVYFTVKDQNGKQVVKSATCAAHITPKGPVCDTNPNLPPESPKCHPCKENPNLPADSPKCVTPCEEHPNTPECKPETPETPETPVKELPNTGAGNIIGLFAGTSAAGGLGYRLYLSRRFGRNS